MSKSVRKFKLRWLKKMTFLPLDIYVYYLYEYFTGKKLNLENPTEFNEKIQWYKVYYHPKILNQLVDKYEVRAYVEKIIGAKYLNELYAVYDSPGDVDFDKLPDSFVIKANHTNRQNLIVNSKAALNKKAAKKKFKRWLKTNQYYRTGKEWAYKDVKPKLIAEKFLKEEGKDTITDYKFYCFNGKAKFFELHVERVDNYKRGFFDLGFKVLPFNKGKEEHGISEAIQKPENFEEMILLSNKLATNFPFVRVDFYSIQGKSIFGEMTFYPADGRKDFYPNKYNKIIGEYFKLPEIPKGEKKITKFP